MKYPNEHIPGQDESQYPERSRPGRLTASGPLLFVFAVAITVLYVGLSNLSAIHITYLRLIVLLSCALVMVAFRPEKGNEMRGKYYLSLLAGFVLLLSSVVGLSSVVSGFDKIWPAGSRIAGLIIPRQPLLGVSAKTFEDEVNKKQALISRKNHNLVKTFRAIEKLSSNRTKNGGQFWLFYGKKNRNEVAWEVRNFTAGYPRIGEPNGYIPAKGDKIIAHRELLKKTAIIIDSTYSLLSDESDAGTLKQYSTVHVIDVVPVVQNGYWILAREDSSKSL